MADSSRPRTSASERAVDLAARVLGWPLASVDDQFAWDEGEGDRSRTWWLAAHRRYFARQAARQGFAMSDDIATVFERFELVWPLA